MKDFELKFLNGPSFQKHENIEVKPSPEANWMEMVSFVLVFWNRQSCSLL